MVARECQMHPCAAPLLLLRFFQVYDEWSWSMAERSEPVLLCNIVRKRGFGFHVWHQPGRGYPSPLMLIITLAYPSQNTAYRFSSETFTVLKEEIARAKLICEERMTKASSTWDVLFTRSNISSEFNSMVEITMQDDNSPSFQDWKGFCGSQLRSLVAELEKIKNVRHVRPFSSVPGGRHSAGVGNCAEFAFGIQLHSQEMVDEVDCALAIWKNLCTYGREKLIQ